MILYNKAHSIGGGLLQSAIAAQRRHDDSQEREPAITSPSPPTKTSRKGRYPTPSTVAGCVIRELYVRGHPRGRAREVRFGRRQCRLCRVR